MAERDLSEFDLAAAFRAYLEDAPTEVRPTELAHQFAAAYPTGGPRSAAGASGSAPAMAWACCSSGCCSPLLVGGPDRRLAAPDHANASAAQRDAGPDRHRGAHARSWGIRKGGRGRQRDPLGARCRGGTPRALRPGDRVRADVDRGRRRRILDDRHRRGASRRRLAGRPAGAAPVRRHGHSRGDRDADRGRRRRRGAWTVACGPVPRPAPSSTGMDRRGPGSRCSPGLEADGDRPRGRSPSTPEGSRGSAGVASRTSEGWLAHYDGTTWTTFTEEAAAPLGYSVRAIAPAPVGPSGWRPKAGLSGSTAPPGPTRRPG